MDSSTPRTPVRAASASASPSQLSSPERQKALDDILNQFCDFNVAQVKHWFQLLSWALDTADTIESRVEGFESFVQTPRWRLLLKTLTQQRPYLPHAFVDAIFVTDSSNRRASLRNLVDASKLLGHLDPIKDHLDLQKNPQQCLQFVLEHAFERQESAPARLSCPASSIASSFSANLFHGPGPGLLSLFLQSSGFGKSRLCVELSTLYPGMLVCLRDSVPSPDDADQVSFPPQDSHVFTYFTDSVQLVNKQENLLAHIHLMAWLALYCDTMAHYLDSIKRASGCFDRPDGCLPVHHHTCWRTIVYYLALAIHSSPSSRFVEATHFKNINPESLYSRARAKLEPLVLNPPCNIMPPFTPVFHPGAATVDIREARQHAPPLLTHQFRSELLKHISHHATNYYQMVCSTLINFDPKVVESQRIISVVRDYLRPAILALERIAPALPTPTFAFLALDECGSFPKLLPLIRRLWFRACPATAWILLIDTNSDLAPLAGLAAREGSRRMQDGGTHQLCRSFSAMPTDVNLSKDDLAAISRLALPPDRHNLSLLDLNLLLPKFGRPLWNDALYQSQGRLQPRTIILKLVYPAYWKWPLQGDPDADPVDKDSQNMLALVSQRIRLHLTINHGTDKFHAFVQHQIAQHLRYINHISSTSETMITSNPSEPALSATAAWSFRAQASDTMRKWGMVVEALVNARSPLGIDVGAQGEQGVMLLCTIAADLVASRTYQVQLQESHLPIASQEATYQAVVAPIKLADWLDTLIGDHYVKTWINFKHVIVLEKVAEKEIDPMLLPELWLRHAAAQGPSNQPGWDLLIPVYHSGSTEQSPINSERFDARKMSYVAIQVKNWAKPVPRAERNKPLRRQDRELLSLLMGQFDSISDASFEKAKNLLVRRSDKEQKAAWHADELRRRGMAVRLGDLSI
ncbi:hypothetical protein [Sporisorium scitamineum]|uniref:Uncharacterized protein n=1 Tax=Sporisorium scitamineum TaxID=49012 RepID=A0A0F7S5F2_9BASI|nr:hypothetical protein [Sporisorium scitamineum]